MFRSYYRRLMKLAGSVQFSESWEGLRVGSSKGGRRLGGWGGVGWGVGGCGDGKLLASTMAVVITSTFIVAVVGVSFAFIVDVVISFAFIVDAIVLHSLLMLPLLLHSLLLILILLLSPTSLSASLSLSFIFTGLFNCCHY